MRIAYVCQYQGPDLIASRGVVRNRTLGGNRKIEMIADALARSGHEVVVLSGGIPADRTLRFFGAFESTVAQKRDRPRVVYAAGWDAPIANLIIATLGSILNGRREARRGFDLILLYNITEYTIAVAASLRTRLGAVPMVLEYEDAVDMSSRGVSRTRKAVWGKLEKWLRPRISGVLAVNELLPLRLGCNNALVLRGMVSDELCSRGASRVPPFQTQSKPVAFFSGSLVAEKGLARLVDLVPRFAGRVRFVVAGAGPLEPMLRDVEKQWPSDFEVLGLLSRDELENRLLSADILLNPHDDDSGAIFPFKVIEYLAAGGVVVTTHCGIVHDPAFEYCELATTDSFGDAIERVLLNRSSAGIRAQRGQTWASARYSERGVRDELARVIEYAYREAAPTHEVHQ